MNALQEKDGYIFPIRLFFLKPTLKLPRKEDVWYQWLEVSVCRHLLFISTVLRVGGGPVFQRRE